MENKEQNAEKPKVVRKRKVPTKELELGAVASLASAKWATSNWLVLLWLTSAEFMTIVNNFNAILRALNRSDGEKGDAVKQFQLLNAEIDDSIAYVKGYILEKFKKARAKSMYPLFGINDSGNYYLPPDHQSRKEALGTLIDGIREHGFQDREYGLEYWTLIKEQYDPLAEATIGLTGDISVKVGDKNELKKRVKLGLNALIKTVQANYPFTWEEELRAWGFQKERY